MRRSLNITLTVLLTIGFILLGVFVFATSYIRFWQGIIDFGLSVGYYFCIIFGIPHNITPTVNEIDEVQTPQVTLPNDFDGFKSDNSQYFSLLFSGDNFNGWLAHISVALGNFAAVCGPQNAV